MSTTTEEKLASAKQLWRLNDLGLLDLREEAGDEIPISSEEASKSLQAAAENGRWQREA